MVTGPGQEFDPEAITRFRAINTLYETVAGVPLNVGDVSLDEWIFRDSKDTRRGADRYLQAREAGFALKVNNIGVFFTWDDIELSELVDTVLDKWELALLALTLPIVYGGIHLSVWNFEFPTAAERLIWRIASIGIATTLPVLLFTGFCLALLLHLRFIRGLAGAVTRRHYNYWWEPGDKIFLYVIGVFMFWYSLARVYIVVEAFFSLRRVPIGVYWTPAWLQMIPHV